MHSHTQHHFIQLASIFIPAEKKKVVHSDIPAAVKSLEAAPDCQPAREEASQAKRGLHADQRWHPGQRLRSWKS